MRPHHAELIRIGDSQLHPIADNIFTDELQPSQIGGRHRDSGRLLFPLPEGKAFDSHPLRRDGRLWSYTIQRFRPRTPPYEEPEKFAPWALGYVEMVEELIVEARLTDVEIDALTIGMPLVWLDCSTTRTAFRKMILEVARSISARRDGLEARGTRQLPTPFFGSTSRHSSLREKVAFSSTPLPPQSGRSRIRISIMPENNVSYAKRTPCGLGNPRKAVNVLTASSPSPERPDYPPAFTAHQRLMDAGCAYCQASAPR